MKALGIHMFVRSFPCFITLICSQNCCSLWDLRGDLCIFGSPNYKFSHEKWLYRVGGLEVCVVK